MAETNTYARTVKSSNKHGSSTPNTNGFRFQDPVIEADGANDETAAAAEWVEFIESRSDDDVIPPRRAGDLIPVRSDEPRPPEANVLDEQAAADILEGMKRPPSASKGFWDVVL